MDGATERVHWYGVIEVESLLDRDYTMFGSLFGLRNWTDFHSAVESRGLPDDLSERAIDDVFEFGEEYHSHTWATWQELEAVNWKEEALTGVAWSVEPDEKGCRWGTRLEHSDPRRMEGNSWVERGGLVRVEKLTRWEALGRQGQLLFDLMRVLAARYGGDAVRLVVWFDS